MAHLLYFRGRGLVVMRGITEYIVIMDVEEVTPEEIKHETAPGFHLHSDIDLGDVDELVNLPTEEVLVRLNER